MSKERRYEMNSKGELYSFIPPARKGAQATSFMYYERNDEGYWFSYEKTPDGVIRGMKGVTEPMVQRLNTEYSRLFGRGPARETHVGLGGDDESESKFRELEGAGRDQAAAATRRSSVGSDAGFQGGGGEREALAAMQGRLAALEREKLRAQATNSAALSLMNGGDPVRAAEGIGALAGNGANKEFLTGLGRAVTDAFKPENIAARRASAEAEKLGEEYGGTDAEVAADAVMSYITQQSGALGQEEAEALHAAIQKAYQSSKVTIGLKGFVNAAGISTAVLFAVGLVVLTSVAVSYFAYPAVGIAMSRASGIAKVGYSAATAVGALRTSYVTHIAGESFIGVATAAFNSISLGTAAYAGSVAGAAMLGGMFVRAGFNALGAVASATLPSVTRETMVREATKTAFARAETRTRNEGREAEQGMHSATTRTQGGVVHPSSSSSSSSSPESAFANQLREYTRRLDETQRQVSGLLSRGGSEGGQEALDRFEHLIAEGKESREFYKRLGAAVSAALEANKRELPEDQEEDALVAAQAVWDFIKEQSDAPKLNSTEQKALIATIRKSYESSAAINGIKEFARLGAKATTALGFILLATLTASAFAYPAVAAATAAAIGGTGSITAPAITIAAGIQTSFTSLVGGASAIPAAANIAYAMISYAGSAAGAATIGVFIAGKLGYENLSRAIDGAFEAITKRGKVRGATKAFASVIKARREPLAGAAGGRPMERRASESSVEQATGEPAGQRPERSTRVYGADFSIGQRAKGREEGLNASSEDLGTEIRDLQDANAEVTSSSGDQHKLGRLASMRGTASAAFYRLVGSKAVYKGEALDPERTAEGVTQVLEQESGGTLAEPERRSFINTLSRVCRAPRIMRAMRRNKGALATGFVLVTAITAAIISPAFVAAATASIAGAPTSIASGASALQLAVTNTFGLKDVSIALMGIASVLFMKQGCHKLAAITGRRTRGRLVEELLPESDVVGRSGENVGEQYESKEPSSVTEASTNDILINEVVARFEKEMPKTMISHVLRWNPGLRKGSCSPFIRAIHDDIQKRKKGKAVTIKEVSDELRSYLRENFSPGTHFSQDVTDGYVNAELVFLGIKRIPYNRKKLEDRDAMGEELVASVRGKIQGSLGFTDKYDRGVSRY